MATHQATTELTDDGVGPIDARNRVSLDQQHNLAGTHLAR
jgi:hypothetical protein